jgi:hypothetical protein
VYVILLAALLAAPPKAERPGGFTLELQSGPLAVIPAMSDDDFVRAAQRLADLRGEAVAVTQRGRLVVLMNPRR